MMNMQRSSQKWTFWLILIIVTIYLLLTFKWLIQNQQQQHGRNLTQAEEDAAISLFLQNFDYTMDRDEDDIL